MQSKTPERRSRLAPLGWLSRWLPALVAGMLCLHMMELIVGKASVDLALLALRNDLFGFLRFVWLPALIAAPFLFLGSDRAKMLNVGLAWSLLLALQALLIEYHASTGVPLGGDLFGYSFDEIMLATGGASMRPSGLLGLALALALMWALLALILRREQKLPTRGTLILQALFVVLAIWISQPQNSGDGKGMTTLALNKGAYFIENSMATLFPSGDMEVDAVTAATRLDQAHPFLRNEHTPDTLGPHLAFDAAKPPNFVILVVEGLGRAYSGPRARLGSFTPFLDELGAKSLYFENFLATQGRTFAVLPSILGSLPFGANGYSALGEAMPEHVALPALLKKQGYDLRFYTGSNLDFDNQGMYLKHAQVGTLVSQQDFTPGLPKSSDWGYADRELLDLVLARESSASQPSAAIIQTNSMHTPFAFPDKQRYMTRVEEHLAKLGVAPEKRAQYLELRQVYASILYTDDALRHYFDAASKLPGYANTVFFITGDHRMPEIPMENRLERYHVPLIVFSPLLKAPLAIKSVSSHFDIAPSVAAFLASNYAMPLPKRVSWMGTGLDLEPAFRNLHVLPIKQTKTELSDFVSGTAYLGKDKLYSISDGMEITPLESAGAREKVQRQFDAFMLANSALTRGGKLVPASAISTTRPFDPTRRSLSTMPPVVQSGVLYVTGARISSSGNGEVRVSAKFSNRSRTRSPAFVPLMVLLDARGNELREAYGKVQTLSGNGAAEVELSMAKLQLAPGTYFVSVIPSDPENGKSLGSGQYRIAVDL
ncbi:MAG: LTA synthase family protein [Pseudomonadota bacterium]